MQPEQITLTLSVQEINTILGIISKGPYDQVVDLIDKIRSTAVQQLNPQPKPEE